jgi:hypothetical protein
MKEKIKTKKEKRQEAEKNAAKKKETLPYPPMEELRAESEEAKPEVYFMVYDESGAAIRRVEGSNDAGFQRVAWDLRYPAPALREHGEEDEDDDFPPAGIRGPLVISGMYSVKMFERLDGSVTELAGAQTFRVATDGASALSAADRTAQAEFQRKVAGLYRAVSGALHTTGEVDARLKAIRGALRETPGVETELAAAADSIEQRNRAITRALSGDRELQKRNEPVPSSIGDRVNAIMEGERFSLSKPTQSHIDDYQIAAGEFAGELAKLRALVEVDMVKLEKDMERAGAPWTPGRVPEWEEK